MAVQKIFDKKNVLVTGGAVLLVRIYVMN